MAVAGVDEDLIMPPKGDCLTANQIGSLPRCQLETLELTENPLHRPSID